MRLESNLRSVLAFAFYPGGGGVESSHILLLHLGLPWMCSHFFWAVSETWMLVWGRFNDIDASSSVKELKFWMQPGASIH